MSFRVVHFSGSKELLMKKIAEYSKEVIDHEDKDILADGEWDLAIQRILNHKISSSCSIPFVLSVIINDFFPAVSEDYGLSAYDALAAKTSGRLSQMLSMFQEGRHFQTGRLGFGEEGTCGYLSSEEVVEFLDLIKAYHPDSACEGEKELVDELISTFSTLAERNSGDLFVMS
jgi:hypothetical protein